MSCTPVSPWLAVARSFSSFCPCFQTHLLSFSSFSTTPLHVSRGRLPFSFCLLAPKKARWVCSYALGKQAIGAVWEIPKVTMNFWRSTKTLLEIAPFLIRKTGGGEGGDGWSEQISEMSVVSEHKNDRRSWWSITFASVQTRLTQQSKIYPSFILT